MSKKPKVEIRAAGEARSLHICDEDKHLVGLGLLRVLIMHDGPHWVAQGVEIDYAAAGDSLADVQARFQRGLIGTIREHLKKYESIDRILKYAPEAARKPLIDNQEFEFTTVSFHDLTGEQTDGLPFGNIVYMQPQAALSR